MKKAVIVSCFDSYTYDVRIKYVEHILIEEGYDVIILTADYDHRKKEKYIINREGIQQIHVPEYRRNLSFRRIYSHYCFSNRVYKKLKKINPDIIYASVPPNFVYKYCVLYKRKNNQVRLIFDVSDMWPETLPISDFTKKILKLPLKVWISLRNRYICDANALIYECNLFREYLNTICENVIGKTIYLCKKDYLARGTFDDALIDISCLHFLYLGSVNNIIDIDLIICFLKELNQYKEIRLHIIGNGEKSEDLCQRCFTSGIKYYNYGEIYNDEKKKEIIKNCHFGLNIMKKEVFVGITMKSLEYFHWGLALINNIAADSYSLVKNEQCGININWDNYIQYVNYIIGLDVKDILKMKNNSRKVFEKYFSEKNILTEYKVFLKNVISWR